MTKMFELDKEIRYDRFDDKVIILIPSAPSLVSFPIGFFQILEAIEKGTSRQDIISELDMDPSEVDQILQKMLDCHIIKEAGPDE